MSTHVMTPANLDHRARHQAWTIDRGSQGFTWNRRLRFGNVEVGHHVHRHRYTGTPDRWVFQPWLTIDRKRKAS